MRRLLIRRMLVVAVVALAVGGCTRLEAGASQSEQPSASASTTSAQSTALAPSPSPSGARATADQLLAGVLSSQPHGKASAAAYVETTYGVFEGILAPESRLPVSADTATHGVIVLKVFGSFPNAHRGAPGANTDATTIVVVYDTTLATTVESAYFRGPEPADLSGAAASPRADYVDLRSLGTPVALTP